MRAPSRPAARSSSARRGIDRAGSARGDTRVAARRATRARGLARRGPRRRRPSPAPRGRAACSTPRASRLRRAGRAAGGRRRRRAGGRAAHELALLQGAHDDAGPRLQVEARRRALRGVAALTRRPRRKAPAHLGHGEHVGQDRVGHRARRVEAPRGAAAQRDVAQDARVAGQRPPRQGGAHRHLFCHTRRLARAARHSRREATREGARGAPLVDDRGRRSMRMAERLFFVCAQN